MSMKYHSPRSKLKAQRRNKMELTLERRWKKDSYTIGRLYINGELFCNTLEDKDRGLTQGMSKEEIKAKKVQNETAIPKGRYRISMRIKSPKYSTKKQYAKCGGYLPRLKDVPGYSGVLIHIGNWASDSAGCILVGENKVKGGVVNSTTFFWKLYDILKAADERNEEIWITIKD